MESIIEKLLDQAKDHENKREKERIAYELFGKLKRGDIWPFDDSGATVYYSHNRKSGGAGMGEYPEEINVVLSNGKVYNADSWNLKVKEVK